MSTYTIGEAAERSGFSPSALRYYEGIGLVSPATRTEAGYRLYDDRAMERLALVARAKQLGCSLEEITDLVELWDGERCDPVQQRLHRLVTDKIRDARAKVDELTAFTGQLEEVATRLAGPAADGACGPECACLTQPPPAASRDESPGTSAIEAGHLPIACTLDPAALPDRLAQWRAVLGRATGRSTTPDGTVRIEFGGVVDGGVDVGELARLASAEQRCCAFFTFTIAIGAAGTTLDVQAPGGATAKVDQLLAVGDGPECGTGPVPPP